MATAVFCYFLSSCQKEITGSGSVDPNRAGSFFEKVEAQLEDSLSRSDYQGLDFSRLYKSKDAQSDGCFVRGAFRNKELVTDFILLRTDSLGNIREGKIVHVDQDKSSAKRSDPWFGGAFIISSLDRQNCVTKKVANERWVQPSGIASLLEQEAPAGEQVLPDVVVTSTSYDGGPTGSWLLYGGFFGDYDVTGGGGYTYGSSTGGGGSSNNNDGNTDNTIIIEVEPNDEPPIKVEDYVKCFGNVPDANATYQVSIFTDIPVDGDPSELFNWSTNSPGHSFVQLIKTSATNSVRQTFGFYPMVGWKSLGPYPGEGKVVDNGGHEFNASLTQSVSSIQFQQTISMMEALQYSDYDISEWNCTDFALSVYNASAYNPLTIPLYLTENSTEPMSTPQGLYTEIQLLQASGNTVHGTPNVPGIAGHAGESHGSCGD